MDSAGSSGAPGRDLPHFDWGELVVIPAKAGIQISLVTHFLKEQETRLTAPFDLDPGLRRGDEEREG